ACGEVLWHEAHRGDVVNRPCSTSRSAVGCGQRVGPNTCGGGAGGGGEPLVAGAAVEPPPPPPHPTASTAQATTPRTATTRAATHHLPRSRRKAACGRPKQIMLIRRDLANACRAPGGNR